jgi:hypothetical protein
MFKIDNIQSQSGRQEEEVSAAFLYQSTDTERPIPPLVKEETSLPISEKGEHTDPQTGRRSHKPALGK